MSLTILTIVTIITSPWFILITFEKITPAKFYLPTIGELLRNFFSHLSFDFLFFSGDPIIQNSIPEVGAFYLWQLPFLLIGLYLILKKPNWLLILSLILTACFGSLFKPSPNLLVAVPLFFLLSLIIAKGLKLSFSAFLKEPDYLKIICFLMAALFIIYNTFFSLHQFRIHYPKRLQQNLNSGS